MGTHLFGSPFYFTNHGMTPWKWNINYKMFHVSSVQSFQ